MAAAVFIPPSPHAQFPTMAASTRRAPLASIPNATNSPGRFLTNSGSKRPRAVGGIQQQENEPPMKRQALEKSRNDNGIVTPRRHPQPPTAEGRVFERGTTESGTNAFQRRLVAARDKSTTQSRNTKTTTGATKDVESIRQWQRHYRKLFPNFRFYFDSIAQDQKAQFIKQINQLGASEEKFFSRNVTHIVTTRSVPQADSVNASNEDAETVNPSALDKVSRARKDAANQNDVLTRGLQMDMKIWAAEKLQRMLTSLMEDKVVHETASRSHAAGSRTQMDLSQIMKRDRLAAVAEKEATMPREMITFRGPFLYIHDMDEKVRPIMVREYAKVGRRQDGEWPQFRSASMGKCPFVEDPAMKKEIEQERARQKAQAAQEKEASKLTRTKTSHDLGTVAMEPPRRTSPRKVLREVNNPRAIAPQPAPAKTAPPPIERQSSFPPMPEQPPVEFIRPSEMLLTREPSASGIQRSNITSAIQSQMISSAAATGLKAGTSKEVNELKRKVLERTHTGSLSVGSISSSHRMNDLAGVLKHARAPAPERAAKSKAQAKLGGIQEEDHGYEAVNERATIRKRKAIKRDPKPGYCENCRDKYDDFEEHILARKHRKFAMDNSNWEDLDALLDRLQVP